MFFLNIANNSSLHYAAYYIDANLNQMKSAQWLLSEQIIY